MIHGGDIYGFFKETGIQPIDFSENTNPLGLPENIKNAIVDNINNYSVYPDINCTELAEKVGKFHAINKDFLLFGNGAADIIFRIAYGIKPKKALVLAPTFAEYELAMNVIGTQTEYYFLKDDFAVKDDILTAISGKDIVFICNPNNPTGILTDKTLLIKIAETMQKSGGILVVDECFMDFIENSNEYSLVKEIKNIPNLIILKAFTKMYAMAGIRLGYCICSNKNILEKLKNVAQPWSVSTVAQVAGITACDENDYVKKTLNLIKEEKIYLEESLKKLGFKIIKGKANYILFKTKKDIVTPLKKYGIMVRSCKNYVGLNENYYRIGIKTREQNQILINALNEFIK